MIGDRFNKRFMCDVHQIDFAYTGSVVARPDMIPSSNPVMLEVQS